MLSALAVIAAALGEFARLLRFLLVRGERRSAARSLARAAAYERLAAAVAARAGMRRGAPPGNGADGLPHDRYRRD